MLHKKSLGQHFLRSEGALKKIIEAAKLSSDDTVLEVGPGEGVLTKLLLQQAGRVIAVEKDDRLIPELAITFGKEIAAGKLELIHADILKYELGIRNYKKGYKVVANIPYYITGALIRKFLESEAQPSAMVLLLQKEVAKRIVGVTDTTSPRLRRAQKESILSISVKAYGTPKYVDTVKAGAFSPPPNVDSGILAIEGISKKFFDGIEEKNFFKLLKKGFAHPRKLLSSNLGISPEELRKCGIAEKARPENLSLQDWRALARSYRT
ncbi:MAG: 16S rRNA (adenine(1518)-N(6)/adenine(1519)-N(6))-dimethyltransferase RsmA [bacterium]|nr:16S rRNA (adenine(1518)-N(6)/adenine(1519)-N(6))-dimethyltransferase RsmA [bacterium]